MDPESDPPARLAVASPRYDSSTDDAIRLLREANVADTSPGGTFRYSRSMAAGVASLILLAGIGLVVIGRSMGNPFAYYIAALLFMVLWIYQSMVVARFRSTNWLVRVGERGLYLKFRSYLNHHFTDSGPTVVYVPFRDIRLTRLVRELQEVIDTDARGTSERRRTIIEIELATDARELADALTAERRVDAPKVARWYGSSAGKYQHHPVRMSTPRTVVLEWGVRPGAKSFLAVMAVHAKVESTEIVRDYTTLRGRDPREQESRLLELVENGQILDAIRLARSLYGYDLTQAKSFVDGLSGRAKV